MPGEITFPPVFLKRKFLSVPYRRTIMNETENSQPVRRRSLSLDAWAVTAAFVLAALVRTGLLKHIPW
jgi:hypothetical protein